MKLRLGRGDPVGLQLAIQMAPLDAELLRRPRHVPLVGAELAQDVRSLECLAGFLERTIALRVLACRRLLARAERGRQVLGPDHVSRRHDDEPLHHVAQLAHVARPVVGEEVGEGLHGHRLGAAPVLRREEGDEVLHEGGDVLLAPAQRGHLDGNDVEAVEEILAEAPRGDLLLQVLVGSGDDAHVDAERLLAAHPLEGLLLQHAKDLGLCLEAHVRDLVEEQRTAIGQLELAAPSCHRAGEGAALVAEELGLDQLLGDGGAVHLHERAIGARGAGVYGPGHQLLARPAVAVDQHAARGGRGDVDLLAQLLDGCALAHDLLAPLHPLAQAPVLLLETGMLESPRGDQEGLLEGERLLDEVVGAQLGRLHRRLDGGVAGDHHHRRLGAALLHLREGLQPVHAGHPDVEEDEVRRIVHEAGQRFLRRARRGDAVALVLEHAAQRALDEALVIHDEDVLARHQLALAEVGGSTLAAARRPTGNSMMKRVPWGVTSSTQIVPPWSVTIWCTMDSPSPVPLGLVEKYGRKSRSLSSAWIPGPSSATTMRARRLSGIQIVSRVTWPEPPTASTALSTRLRTARLIWSGSTSIGGMSGEKVILMSRAPCDSR